VATVQEWIDSILRRSGINPAAGQRVAPGAVDPDFIASQQQPPAAPSTVTELGPPAGTAPAPQAGPEAPATEVPPPPQAPYPADTKDSLERALNEVWRIERERERLRGVINDPATTPGNAQRARDDLLKQDALFSTASSQVQQEENRRRDDAKIKADKEAAEGSKPKNGDTKNVRVEHKGVSGTVTQTYNNGVWSDDPGSFKVDSSIPNNTATATPRQVLTDGQGKYWTFDPSTGKAEPLGGLAGKGDSVVTLGDGTSWLAGPDGKPRTKLTEAKPTSSTVDNFLVLSDPMTGKVITRVDLLDPTQRERATRLADLAVKTAEQGLEPKFANAGAQYTQEAQRRQGLARQELERLTKLQQEGQISPEQAEAQFDAWMKVNVEGPLAGYKRAADEERRVQEQANLDRETAERTRVEAANRERDRLAFEAGEAGRREGITLGQRTRAPEYIADLGGLANSLASGRTDFKFSPGSFDVANFRKAVPNLNELADAAVNRLLSRVPRAEANPNVSVPLTPPVGDDLRASMNSVRYSGPMSSAPTNEQPLEGQGALDQGNGMARSVYSNGRYVDWAIPQLGQAAAPTPAAQPTAPAAGGLPGQLAGESEEERRARWAAIMGR
jgi:hypothetical protein